MTPKEMTLNDVKWLLHVCDEDHFAHFAETRIVFVVSHTLLLAS